MATVHSEGKRIEYWVTIVTPNHSRTVHVADDGWQIRLRDDEGNTLYVFCPPDENTRVANRETGITAIQAECGWWDERRDFFCHPPKPPEWLGTPHKA
jgi:hypothetical protein